MPCVHRLCTELWSSEMALSRGKVWEESWREGCAFSREMFCLFSKIGRRGVVWRRLCKGQVSSCLNCPFLQIISKVWGRKGSLVVRITLQLSLFRMHTVAFL